MLNDIIVNVVSAGLIALCKFLYEKLKQKKTARKATNPHKENVKFYISLLFLYISFIVQVLAEIPFVLRFISGGIGGFCISEIAIIHYRLYQETNNKYKPLPQKGGKKHRKK